MSKKFKNPSDEIWTMTKEFRKDLKEMAKQQAKSWVEFDERMKKSDKQLVKSRAEFDEQLAKSRVEFDKQLAKSRAEFDEQLAKSRAEFNERMKKSDEQLAKSRAEFNERMKKSDAQLAKSRAEFDARSEATDKKLNKYFGNFGNDWGVFGENLVKGNLAKRLIERGIKVDKVFTNLKNQHSEFDIIAINGKETVVVEVKSKLGEEDVDKFLSQMKQFNKYWPDLSKGKVYGAMAFLVKGQTKAIDKAKEKGFFVISATGDVIIKNKKDFCPTAFVN